MSTTPAVPLESRWKAAFFREPVSFGAGGLRVMNGLGLLAGALFVVLALFGRSLVPFPRTSIAAGAGFQICCSGLGLDWARTHPRASYAAFWIGFGGLSVASGGFLFAILCAVNVVTVWARLGWASVALLLAALGTAWLAGM